MNNKDFLLKTLSILSQYWDWAKTLFENVKADNYDESTLEYLAEQVRASINEVKDEKIKTQLWKWLDIIKKIAEMEKNDTDEEEVKNLESMIDNL